MREVELLRKEHKANAIPFSRSPFPDNSAAPKPEDGDPPRVRRDAIMFLSNIHSSVPSQELELDELRVIAPEEVPWIGPGLLPRVNIELTNSIDLLLEIAMTTAFASLT